LCSYTELCVTLTELPVTFTVPLQDKEVMEKSTVTLTCETAKPKVGVKWHKNGQEVMVGKKYKPSQDGATNTLEINNALRKDTAEYSCTIVSSLNKTTGKLIVKGRYQFCR